MQIGLLGKANVGKSTFFSAATQTPAAIGNFPFTTIKPNIGVAHVTTTCACNHFDIKHDINTCINGTRLIPIKLVDIAGLVPGAHEGKGLGNQFLDDARQSMALIHVVDIAGTTDIQGQPVPAGTHNPLEDIKFVQDEFDQWFTDILKRDWDKITREVDQKRTKLVDGIARRFTGLSIVDFDVHEILHKLNLESKNPKEWTDSDLHNFAQTLRQKTKPMIIAANKADLCNDNTILDNIINNIPKDISNNTLNSKLCSAETELLLRKAAKANIISYISGDDTFTNIQNDISAPQKKALDIAQSVLTKIKTTGVQQILNSSIFDLLDLIVVYPVEDETKLTNKDGDVLPDAHLVHLGTTPKDVAGIVHAELAKGFLHAIDCKTHQRIGADHKLKDGDVIKIVSTSSRG